jgi:adenylate kinase family enzyme
MESFPFKRIVVIGSTSSGKSTLAKQLAQNFSLDYIDLDELHWEPNWHEADDDVFRSRVEAATSASRWVVAGNYQVIRGIVWPRAEALIWMDYSFLRVFWQLTVRSIRRSITQEEVCNGNREKFWWHLKLWSDESIFRWLFKTYWRNKHAYPQSFVEPRHSHLRVLHFRSPREVNDWVRTFATIA